MKDYIKIISTGYFSEKRINNCLINLDECKIYNITYDKDGKEKYEFYKELSNDQKKKLLNYINLNNLLNLNFDNMVFDASDVIEINISGKKNVIENASREFTNNEVHIFDDIVYIVFYPSYIIPLQMQPYKVENNENNNENISIDSEKIIGDDEVELINRNSLLPVEFLSDNIHELEKKQIGNLYSFNNYMSYDYSCIDFELKYSGYPSDEDKYKMNYLKLKTNKYHFIGINIGVTTIKEIDMLLKKYGFVIFDNKEINCSNNNQIYKNKNCMVEFSIKYNIVDWIKIEFKSMYLGNRMY